MKINPKNLPVIILTTLPDSVAAEKLSMLLVERKLAACVNIIPGIRSIYIWKDKLVRDDEVKLLIKTSSARAPEAQKLIRENHSYSVPEITTLGLNGDVAMEPDYWRWLTDYLQ
ncbi:MAG TPA: divalent-cation tolerance protein CutA [Turneriella sp.]|nr:divalent-cation tolerance protein CutA [Turneriella sp.]HNA78909.1 divalent-cation tolerance protein CutA [Turneriella sp.]HNE18654.1 divalent-cation tolerance protein CutA [Turneriella sp.]HNJ65400.1 divalent-cation tolerance protein CutA [Turneriella sp.]HNL09213.1 divalent-cation tolerance protein CutA [Turneriella sp.]